MGIDIKEIQTQRLDHFGLIASICDELEIVEQIDSILGPIDPRKKISYGQAVKIMIINGLGFIDHRLYMTKNFYKNKPVSILLGDDIELKNINDYVIGKTLERISKYGVTPLFSTVALNIAEKEGLFGTTFHLDTTSVYVEGEYKDCEDDDLVRAVKLTQGHSRDHRPDLKQLVLSLTVTGPASMPFWVEVLNGNSSDKKNMPDTIERVRNFRKQIKESAELIWVCDSAAYSKDGILSKAKDWICRVPENIKESRELLEKYDSEVNWTEYKKGYKVSKFVSNYGDCEQRWLLVYSQQAFEREKKTFDKNLSKKEENLKKEIWHLENDSFHSKKMPKKQ